jgi:hypothetical protein
MVQLASSMAIGLLVIDMEAAPVGWSFGPAASWLNTPSAALVKIAASTTRAVKED